MLTQYSLFLEQKNIYSLNNVYRSVPKNKCDDNASFKNKYSIGNNENYFLGKGRILISLKTGTPKEKANIQPFVTILS